MDSAVFYSGDKRCTEQVRIDMLLRIVARLMHRQGMSERRSFRDDLLLKGMATKPIYDPQEPQPGSPLKKAGDFTRLQLQQKCAG